MLAILSPSKTFSRLPADPAIPVTTPRFEREAEKIAATMRGYSRDELAEMMKISVPLSGQVFHFYRRFSDPDFPARPAVFTYEGNVYKELRPRFLSPEDLLYAQDHLRVVSTLYGVLRPLDGIRPYRMSFTLSPGGMEGTLYDFWREKITDDLLRQVRKMGAPLINLTSKEISDAIDWETVKREVQVITPEFREFRDGKFPMIRTYIKSARGAMARFLVENRVKEADRMKTFHWSGYEFRDDLSDDSTYVFTR